MSYLNQLVDEHLQSLAGAEFKVAAFLYRRLERRDLVEMTIAELAAATGVCAKQVHVVAKHLRNSGLLRIESRRGCATKYSLPSASTPALPVGTPSAAPSPAPSPATRRSSLEAKQQPPPVTPSAIPPVTNPTAKLKSVAPGPISNPSQTPVPVTVAGPQAAIGDPKRSVHDLAPAPPTMTPEEREREQCRQLASELMGGRPVDDGTIDKLNLSIQHQSPRPVDGTV